ncbi:hypothetical protein RJ641_029870 [Dillenia turbinata]|uniref:Uncharacterized protein n=1 Tax=Dillenia turbinata TaxID=194707 RepID=A0AAN8VZ35_9MAGN
MKCKFDCSHRIYLLFPIDPKVFIPVDEAAEECREKMTPDLLASSLFGKTQLSGEIDLPQGNRDLKELDGLSIVAVRQIDCVVEVVEETLKGHEVQLLTRKTLPALDLPKVLVLIARQSMLRSSR